MSGPNVSSTNVSLLRRLRNSPRDDAAWDDFARRYGPIVYRWCLQWKVQEADANDITQNVLLKLVERLQTFEYQPGGSFRAWLKTVTYHAWAKFVSHRQPTTGGSDESLRELFENLQAPEDLATRLAEEYDRELLEQAMLRVASRVEPHTWEAFRLTALEGHSGNDVAERLEMRVATVYVARSKVQRLIQEEIQLADTE